ncbi:unnamed protein product [Trifolium pratense]|uniref:Uncharacterized protein n=1 Tax=Trifolium pratense TaxID=57577 RepID=A0ACB0MA71_TRIPR|nr:unnamed protein product [Trifolium pratense]
MSNLVCLQTIKLLLDEKVVLSTKDVSKLINLRHLMIYDWTFRDKAAPGFGKLSIQQHKGLIFSNWLSSLTNIIEISLDRCGDFRYLPPLERLPFLKSLELNCLHELEYIYYEEPMLHKSFFPSLESLIFWQCHELRGWRRMREDFNDIKSSHHLMFPEFSCLSKLSIDGCLRLTCMPSFPNIKRLSLNDCSVEILEETLNIAMSRYSIGFPPLSMLKFFKINETIMDVTNVPQDWLRNLTSLENLKIDHLSSQQFQVIEMWFKVDLICLPSLKKITFHNCFHLKALPDWICNDLPSLQHIKMINCRDLVSLPEGMPRLTNLRTLEIIECPLLVGECRTETSATWSKIAHIPNINMK